MKKKIGFEISKTNFLLNKNNIKLFVEEVTICGAFTNRHILWRLRMSESLVTTQVT